MTRTVLTGGGGFLGWHTRAALHERGDHVTSLAVGDGFDLGQAVQAVSGADLVIHLAGVNRGTEDEIVHGNALFANQLSAAIEAADAPPTRVVFAGSTQSDTGGLYGDAKARASASLSAAAGHVGGDFEEVRLPNLFGEHGRPFYNAVTATFCHLLANGQEPEIAVDRELTLLHAQDAADLLIGAASPGALDKLAARESVSGLLTRLRGIAESYERGEIPDVSTTFERDLFNTYRSYLVDRRPAIPLTRRADARGSFFEIVRAQGGPGQTSFSTTEPGITRGDHYHRRKIERFIVIAGRGLIELRRLFDDAIVRIPVDGDSPVAVDMPTMWSHRITNTSSDILYTCFWTNDIFDPSRPDTIPEAV
ncbi:NAD-dependent epimerase/dehydratase family protein [Microbacterium sp. AZCO]|uniref:polysaccharide biosynthesis C-terminal domain-containing protein n=1 Tax=Microbacterium sp. AZCO TaxID=3142976 RepID=UPI0031F4055A